MEESTAEAPELPHIASIPESIPPVEQQNEPFPPAGKPEPEAWDRLNTLDFLLEVTAPLKESPVEVPTMEPPAEPEQQPPTL